ncbi:MAG: GTP-binding protein [Nanoarchaeota archaeon]|nr:GTP-binding protein [Nanoarchaeota archaeon]
MKNPFKKMFLIEVENLIDGALAEASKKAERTSVEGDMIEKAKQKEGIRVKTLGSILSEQIKKEADSFPDINKIPKTYAELLEVYMKRESLEKNVSYLNWISKKIKQTQIDNLRELRYARHTQDARRIRKMFYGRAASFLRRSRKIFSDLFELRYLKRLPDLQEMPSIVIAGMPNAGKTSLLYRLTGSKPEIESYAFTTKELMAGYFESAAFMNIQIIDTPGLLDRPLERRNNIEMQAVAVLKVLADFIVYVFDLSEISGPLEKQVSLYEHIKKEFKKPVIAVANKTDIIGIKELGELEKLAREKLIPISCETGDGIEYLKKLLEERAKEKKIRDKYFRKI